MHKFLTIAFATAIAATALPAAAQTAGSKPSCAPGDPIVWENTSTKVYHLQGDKYYGNTKKGAYACRSAADGAGYHVSGSKSSKAGAMSSGAMASPDAMTSAEPMSSASPSAHHHRHHRKSSPASPEPSPAAT